MKYWLSEFLSIQCSKSCDLGIQTRTVSCHRVNMHGFVDPNPLPLHIVDNQLRRSKRKHLKNTQLTENYEDSNDLHKPHTKWNSSAGCDITNRPSSKRHCNYGTCLDSSRKDSFVWKPLEWKQVQYCPKAWFKYSMNFWCFSAMFLAIKESKKGK